MPRGRHISVPLSFPPPTSCQGSLDFMESILAPQKLGSDGPDMLASGLATHYVPSMGCRAILIDKDKNPKWKPWRLEEMKDCIIEEYFKRGEEEEDLKLPTRENLPASAMSKAVKWRR